jgi:F0F1-type ATP synthase delta subunit
MSKRTNRIFTEMCSLVKLTAKEKRLYKYLLEWVASKNDKNPTFREVCKTLHTTLNTYLKTFASLKEKGLTP